MLISCTLLQWFVHGTCSFYVCISNLYTLGCINKYTTLTTLKTKFRYVFNDLYCSLHRDNVPNSSVIFSYVRYSLKFCFKNFNIVNVLILYCLNHYLNSSMYVLTYDFDILYRLSLMISGLFYTFYFSPLCDLVLTLLRPESSTFK